MTKQNLEPNVILGWADIELTTLIALYEFDFTELGGEIYHLANQYIYDDERHIVEPIIYAGRKYEVYPIDLTGVELTSEGSSNRPKLKIADENGLIMGLLRNLGEVIGGRVQRTLVEAKYLDSANFGYENFDANPTAGVRSRYIIERVADIATQARVITLDLAIPTELESLSIPNGIMSSRICQHVFRGKGCNYTGHAVMDITGEPIESHEYEKEGCPKTLSACQGYWFANADLPCFIFPALDRVKS